MLPFIKASCKRNAGNDKCIESISGHIISCVISISGTWSPPYSLLVESLPDFKRSSYHDISCFRINLHK